MGRTEYGSEFDWRSNDALMTSENIGLPIEGAKYYRSGRDAMKALARIEGRKPGRVLLPALCCESMIIPFELNGHEVVFYKLMPTLCADTDDVSAKLCDGAMLVYLNYFGIPAFTDEFLSGLRTKYKDLIIVEDRTQDIVVPRSDGGFQPDAMVASLRKWTALPEGGVLKTALNVLQGTPDRRFGEIRRSVMEKKSQYLLHPEEAVKRAFMAELHSADPLLDASAEPAAMAEEYLELLRRIDFSRIYAQRRKNIEVLRARFAPLRDAGKIEFLTDAPEKSTLYFPLLLKARDEVWHKMIEEKIYCAVIWPIPERAKGSCAVTENTNRHMLGIICDQRYDEADMHFIADTLEAAL